MSLVEAVQHVFNNYATFEGRARRSEYWYYTLFIFIVSFVLGLLAQTAPSVAALSSMFSLVVLIPGIAVTTRRLHDINKSGWFQLLVLVPLLGSIVLIFWLTKDSDPGTNQYGPNPKGL